MATRNPEMLSTLLALAGAPPLDQVPEDCLFGTVQIPITLVKNTANAINLHTGGTPPYSLDVRLAQLFGTATNPEFIGIVSAVKLSVLANNETDAVMNTIRSKVSLAATIGTQTRYIPLFDAIEFWPPNLTMAGGDSTTGVQVKAYSRTPERELLPLQEALVYDASIDTITVYNAADMSAANNLTCVLQLSGCWYPQAWGKPSRRRVGDYSAALAYRNGREAAAAATFSSFDPRGGGRLPGARPANPSRR